MAVKEAKATVTRGRGSPKDEAKARSNARVEDAEARTRSFRTGMSTGPAGTPTLRQGGPILISLEGSKTRGQRPVLKGKRNKDKELSVATKMGTSLTLVNVPASCGWRQSFARRGSTLPITRNSDLDALGDLQIWCSGG